MAINTDHQLREQMSHDTAVFPITFVNGNILHSIRQLSDGEPDPMLNNVFSGTGTCWQRRYQSI